LGSVVNPHCGFAGRFVRKGLEGRGRKTIMGPSLNSQSEFTFRLSLRIYDRNPRKARFFAEQKMRPNEVLKKPSPSVDFL
jgi:hypothetical protein